MDSSLLLSLANSYGLPLVLLYLIGRPILSAVLARILPKLPDPTPLPAVPDVLAPTAPPKFPLLSALLQSFFAPRKQAVPTDLRELHPSIVSQLGAEARELCTACTLAPGK